MKGHEQIVAMRKRGISPMVLWLSDNPVRDHLSVQLEPKDSPNLADLRFVVGMVVQVEGRELSRVKAWVDACEAAGAARVLWTHYRVDGKGEDLSVSVIGIGDSQHVFEDPQ